MINYALTGVALITGASSGIGRATAIIFAQHGCAKIFIGDIDEKGLLQTKEMIVQAAPECQVAFAKLDISDEHSVDIFVLKCVETFSRVDYACNIAGLVPPRQPIIQTDVSTYDKVINVNEYGTWNCHRAEIRQMLQQEPALAHGGRGSIVSVSSIAGINASPGVTPYSSSKFAIIGMVKAEAQDYGPQGIRINVVCPGVTDTEAFRAITPAGGAQAVEAITPVRRLGDPSDIGQAIVFLCSDNASFIQGTTLVVDGGISLQRMAVTKAQQEQGGHHFHSGGRG